jgi:hypothetical protein
MDCSPNPSVNFMRSRILIVGTEIYFWARNQFDLAAKAGGFAMVAPIP